MRRAKARALEGQRLEGGLSGRRLGGWEAVDAPLPEKHDNPGMWHDQFFPPHAADPGAMSTVLSKPASGGKPGDKGGHSVRVAIVIGLADLFFDYGQQLSAAELYEFYTQLRVFAYRRANTQPKGRMALRPLKKQRHSGRTGL